MGCPEDPVEPSALNLSYDSDSETCEGFSLQPNTISIQNSNDVVIGPVTQFHGPVTIVANTPQLLPSARQSSEIIGSLGNGEGSFEKDDKLEAKCVRIKLLVILGAIAVLVMIICTISLVMFKKPSTKTEQPTEYLTEQLGTHKILHRDVWGGRPSLNFTRQLKHPTEYVLISHTAGRYCKTISACSEIMQTLQSYTVSKYKSPDIGYNFLIGADGNIYVGRGWDTVNFHTNGCIAVSFIGNFVFDELTTSMAEALQVLMDEGVQLKKLSNNYKIVAHNQTFATDSPGINVYKEISTWSHFQPGESISWETD